MKARLGKQGGRTETATGAIEETFADIMNIDGRLTAIAPNYLTRLSEVLLIVGKDNKIVEGCDGTATRREC